jgi:hypothetical protein
MRLEKSCFLEGLHSMCLEGCFFSEFSFPTLDGWLFTFKYEIVPLLPNLPCCYDEVFHEERVLGLSFGLIHHGIEV